MYTTENNKKLAEFLGWEVKHYSTPICDIVTPFGQLTETQLKFHNDWNWLMLVAEKIYSLDTYYDEYIDYNSSMFSSGKIELSTNIEAVYNACIEFVEWYNKEQLIGD